MVMATKPVRFMNPVEPLGHKPTAMRNQDTGEFEQLALWSGTVSGPIGSHDGVDLRPGDVDSLNIRRTPATTPSSSNFNNKDNEHRVRAFRGFIAPP